MAILIYFAFLIDKLTFEYQSGNYTYRFTDIHRETKINLKYVD